MNLRKIDNLLDTLNIRTRPQAAHGIWLKFLLPLSLIISVARHPIISSHNYKLSSIFSVGLILTSFNIIYRLSKNRQPKSFDRLQILSSTVIAFLFWVCLNRGVAFSLWSAIFSTIFYNKLYFYILRTFPSSFTLGEAAICCQSVAILLYFTCINIYNACILLLLSDVQKVTLILQFGLLGVACIAWSAVKLQLTTPKRFYFMTLFVIIFIILLPLDFLLGQSVLQWIFSIISKDLQAKATFLYWLAGTTILIYAVSRQIKGAQKASTAIRKIFHILLVAIFIPGLLYNCVLLYLISGVVLGIFSGLELVRILHIAPLSGIFQDVVSVFIDAKDVGIIALTPFYLLVGCTLPLWIHPAPCDVTSSAIFNLLPLLSGLLTVGIGDTAASIVGSNYGVHKWHGSIKSLEGTCACICAQTIAVYAFIYLDLLKIIAIVDYVKIAVAIVMTSVIEAKTDQIDNLVLPLVMYIILI